MDTLKMAERVAEISQSLGRDSLVLGSTDLTHYGFNYGYTPKGVGEKAVEWVKNDNDRRAVNLMVKMDEAAIISEAIENQNACCAGAVGAAIAAAKAFGAKKGEKIVYSTSYDVRPDNSFVGYVGIVFTN
jgi:AmmeMemoRadiSam system protein B